MRLTYALYLEMCLEAALPGFFDDIAEFPFAKELAKLSRAAFRVRYEFSRLEVEGITECDEPRCRQVAERAAEKLADRYVKTLGLDPEKWQELGYCVTVQLVEDAPNPKWTHGMGAENPSVLCPTCSRPMVHRQRFGRKPFWGCSDFPQCRGTRPISE